jgi:hypothetical protein
MTLRERIYRLLQEKGPTSVRAKDIDREKLDADVKAWLKAGNRITKLPSYTEAAPANRASAREPIGGGW